MTSGSTGPRIEALAPGLETYFVRPGRTAIHWLAQIVGEWKAVDQMAPVTVLAPNYYAGRFARWELARSGGYANVRAARLTQLAAQLAGTGQPSLTAVLEESAVRRVALEAGGVLGPMAHHRSLHHALLQLFRELRRLELDSAAVAAGAPTPMVLTALAAYSRFRALTSNYDDANSVRDRATRGLIEATAIPPALAEAGGLVLYLPTRLDPVDARLLAAAARWVPVRAGFPWLEDPMARGDELAREGARTLREVAGRAGPTRVWTTPTRVDPAVERVVRAPDAAEEVREVARSIAADLEQRVALHRTAVLYRQVADYADLVRETFDLAGLPWSALEGKVLAESRPGRALLALLGVREHQFTRAAVMGWVDQVGAPAGLPGTVWDRVSRAANVSRGADQWQQRLTVYAKQRDEYADHREREGNSAGGRAARGEAAQARAMAATVSEVEQALRPPPDGSSWSEFVRWAELLRTTHAGDSNTWAEAERPFAVDVAAALASLSDADQLESEAGTTGGLFLATLQAALEGRSRPVGRMGEGVLVGPVQSVMGLAFDRVYLLGLAEGVFPPAPAADPFFASNQPDPLGRREHRRRAERTAFLTAVAAADGGRLTMTTPDAGAGRAAFPSPWLLERGAMRNGGQPLYTSTFRALSEAGSGAWLRVVRSAQDGVTRAVAAADLEDRRLAEAVRWRGSGHSLARHPLALRSGLALGPGLAARSARGGKDFTPFDGNLADLRATPILTRFVDGTRPMSASAAQTWATCPFRFFLSYVLNVEGTARPEDSWTIDALERGSLVHGILEAFFVALAAEGRPTANERYGSDDFEKLEAIAEDEFAKCEARGVTGHALIWENARGLILGDLRAFLREDEDWRRESKLRPTHFEQDFGTARVGAWPLVEVPMASGTMRFRGYIDRVDYDPATKRAHVFDYKTGSAKSYLGLEGDPVVGGQQLQLALYARAVRAQYGDDTEVGGDYWFVTTKGEFKRVGIPPGGGAVDRRLVEVLTVVGEGITEGAFPQVPGEEGFFGFDNCGYCDFDRICPAARDDNWERKRGSDGHRLHISLVPAAEPE